MADIVLQHRTIADMTREPPPLPVGVWKFRAIKLSTRERTRNTKQGEKTSVEYVLTVEPLEPTSASNKAVFDQVDPETGKPMFDGKRLYLTYNEDFASDNRTLAGFFTAVGFPETESPAEIIGKEKVKGKTAYGELFNRDFERKDGKPGVEQKVRSWSAKGGSAKFAI